MVIFINKIQQIGKKVKIFSACKKIGQRLTKAGELLKMNVNTQERKRKKVFKRLLAVLLLCLLAVMPAMADEDEVTLDVREDTAAQAPAAEETRESAREELIDRIIEAGRQVYEKSGGKLMRAHYAGDIYVCKNFTVYVFNQCAGDFRMAEYPEMEMQVPANLPAKECKPYSYGFYWKDVPASQGNPFYVAAQFIYDAKLSKAENMQKAVAFMKEVKKGDYFQMSAKYYYGVGAHSAIMISDYDPDTNTVHWMDSNMVGQKKSDGLRYGKVQFNAEKDIEWWADAFCKKTRGATLYRLRDDIVRKP